MPNFSKIKETLLTDERTYARMDEVDERTFETGFIRSRVDLKGVISEKFFPTHHLKHGAEENKLV